MQTKKSKKKDLKKLGFLGGDVSKGTCNFVLQDEDGAELEANFQLDDNRPGHQKLYELIKRFKQDYRMEKVVIGLESTGGYENCLLYTSPSPRDATLSRMPSSA